jgi:hypothetical protein
MNDKPLIDPPPTEFNLFWCSTCGRTLHEKHAWHVANGQLGERCAGVLIFCTYRLGAS